MKTLLISASALALLFNCLTVGSAKAVDLGVDSAAAGEAAIKSAQSTARNYNDGSNSNMNVGGAAQSQEGATPVKGSGDVDYSKGAGNAAANADMALTAASVAFPLVVGLLAQLKATRAAGAWLQEFVFSNAASAELVGVWEWGIFSWFPVYASFNPFETFITLGHAAINKYMRDATSITASFTGAQGHVTDKWVGPPNKNKQIPVLKEFSVDTQRFSSLAFDAADYAGLTDPSNASARELMNYRNNVLAEEQRSLSNVTEDTWGVRYRAQRRSINALALAFQAKETLAALAQVDSKITPDYTNKTGAISTLAARRVVYDALMFLKMNIMAARTKMRAETLELDFKPVETNPTENDGAE